MIRSEGQRRLVEKLKTTTQREIARKVKRSEPSVSLWLSGENKPDVESAAAVQDAYGISADLWARKPKRKRAA